MKNQDGIEAGSKVEFADLVKIQAEKRNASKPQTKADEEPKPKRTRKKKAETHEPQEQARPNNLASAAADKKPQAWR